jgi:hypothetical protein
MRGAVMYAMRSPVNPTNHQGNRHEQRSEYQEERKEKTCEDHEGKESIEAREKEKQVTVGRAPEPNRCVPES